MLDAEARTLLDLMEQANKAGRPKLETLPHSVGRKAVDKMSEDSEADPMDVAEVADGAFAGPGSDIRFRRYRPAGVQAGDLPTLIYYHGGGFVMAGFCAEFCVLSTYRGARDLDYFPILLKNGVASSKEENKLFVENMSETITAGALKKFLDKV